MSNEILYEQPLNERMRVFLRLEHFFLQILHFTEGKRPQDSQAAIAALIEILSILERNDVRTEVLKELERHILGLTKLQESPGVDHQGLNDILEKLTAHSRVLHQSPFRPVSEFKENELINSIRQRTAISAGTCGFDIPAYYYFLNQPANYRSERLSLWLNDFKPLQEGINLLLAMARNSAFFEPYLADNGFFQKSLDAQNPCQLIRIKLPDKSGVYPEVSGSKHRVNVRLLAFSELGRPKQILHSQDFEMSCCAI